MSIEDKIKLAEYLIETMVEVQANLDEFCSELTVPKHEINEWIIARRGLSAQIHSSNLIHDLEKIHDDLLGMKEDSNA